MIVVIIIIIIIIISSSNSIIIIIISSSSSSSSSIIIIIIRVRLGHLHHELRERGEGCGQRTGRLAADAEALEDRGALHLRTHRADQLGQDEAQRVDVGRLRRDAVLYDITLD